MRILVVDDSELIRDGVAKLLNKRGYETIEAESVAEALRQLEDASVPVNLVLSDYHLKGDGLGTEIAQYMRLHNHQQPFILMSNDPETSKFARMLDEGTIGHFWPKHHPSHQMLEMVKTSLCLEKHPSESGSSLSVR